MRLVALTEEPSMKVVLDTLLPQILPEDVTLTVIPFNGRGDLENNIERKLRGWNEPDVRFLIVEDQDNSDCLERKRNLAELVEKSGKSALVRIACRELEAWYFGDLHAIEEAYGLSGFASRYIGKAKYREPDSIVDVKEKLEDLIPQHEQIEGAKRISKHMIIDRNTSVSFQMLISGVQNMFS